MEIEKIDDPLHDLPVLDLLPGGLRSSSPQEGAGKDPGLHVDVPAQQEVVHDRGVGEELDVLKGAGDPLAGDAVGG